jgi:hypothetical protein
MEKPTLSTLTAGRSFRPIGADALEIFAPIAAYYGWGKDVVHSAPIPGLDEPGDDQESFVIDGDVIFYIVDEHHMDAVDALVYRWGPDTRGPVKPVRFRYPTL